MLVTVFKVLFLPWIGERECDQVTTPTEVDDGFVWPKH